VTEVPRLMRRRRQFEFPPSAEQLAAEAEWWRLLGQTGPDEGAVRFFELAEVAEAKAARLRRAGHRLATKPTPDSRELVARVKQVADILAVFGSRVPGSVAKAGPWGGGRKVWLHCPFHADRRPSLVVYADQQTFWCYQCNQGGDAIAAVMLLDDLDFRPALLRLADEFGVEAPKPKRARIRVLG
jgi:CHC2-type zinc finger protein